MKALRFALIAALVLAAVPAVMAGNRDGISTPILPATIAVGGLYDSSQLFPQSEDAPPVSLPMPSEPTELNLLKDDVAVSPVVPFGGSSKADYGASLGGSALVSPRGGGPLSSPQQLAEREIDRLIRRLH